MKIVTIGGVPGSGKSQALTILAEHYDRPIINSRVLMQSLPSLMTKVAALAPVTLVDEVSPKDLQKLKTLAALYPDGYYMICAVEAVDA